MKRLEILDGLRGYFLVFMFLTHLTFQGGYMLWYVNHAQLGFVQDAQGFVFMSGLLTGMVYTRRMARDGFSAGAKVLWRRAGELYAYTIGCIIAVLLLRMVLPGAAAIWAPWLGNIGTGAHAFDLATASLLYQATYLDILPQYIVYMLAAPPLVWLTIQGRWLPVVAGSALLWFAVQLGLHFPLADAINASLKSAHPDLAMRVPFNVLAWQALFIIAMVIGSLIAQKKFETGRYFSLDHEPLFRVASACLLFFLAVRLGFTFEIMPDDLAERFRTLENRAEFGPIFAVNFVILGYVLAWLLIVGRNSESTVTAWIANALTWLFNLPFLRLLGRHSLQIYAWHVVLVYIVFWFDGRFGPLGELTKTAFALGGLVLLSLPAVWRERNREARQPATVEAKRTKAA